MSRQKTTPCVFALAFLLITVGCSPDDDDNNRSQMSDVSPTGETGLDADSDSQIDSSDAEDPSNGQVDIVVTQLDREFVPPKEEANIHFVLSATVTNEGTDEAEGLDCRYKIEPREMEGSIDTIRGSVPLNTTTVTEGTSREVQVEIDRDHQGGIAEYDALFEIRCFVDNETASGTNNDASMTGYLDYY